MTYQTYYLYHAASKCVFGFTTQMGPTIVKMANEQLELKGIDLRWVPEEELP